MSTYSPDLRIELITTGDQAGTWGTTTNTNLAYVIEQAVAGYISVAVASANQALTYINGGSATAALNQSVHAAIALTTSTGANFAVYAPPASKQYTIYNASSYTATLYNSTVIGNTTAAGAGVAIPAGKTVTVWSDGTNFYFQNNHLSALTLDTDLAIADGGTGASTAASARTNLGLGTMATQAANSVAITGGSITGITDLAIADGGTGASTAADARSNLGLGTMATQAASSVAITGGSITGITDLAIADGGTGASTAADARTNLDVPSRSGSGASGSWAINAATATSPQAGGTFITSNNIAFQTVANATNATSATNATNATNASFPASGGSFITSSNIGSQSVAFASNATSAAQVATTNFLIYESGGKLLFKYGGTTVASMDSSGVFTALSDITAGGTP